MWFPGEIWTVKIWTVRTWTVKSSLGSHLILICSPTLFCGSRGGCWWSFALKPCHQVPFLWLKGGGAVGVLLQNKKRHT